jgi:hypothetical protein
MTDGTAFARIERKVLHNAMPPESVPAVWMRLRHLREYGHAARVIVQLVGLCALGLSVLVETPQSPPQEHGGRQR